MFCFSLFNADAQEDNTSYACPTGENAMRRVLCVLLVFTFAVPFVHAAARPGDPIQLVVSPSAAPRPSLKYRLMPDRRDLTPGNAATLYYRAMASFVENSELLKEIREQYWYDWLETPVKDLPMEQVREKLGLARHLLHEVELASRCKDCDWQIEDRSEGIGLLLPEVQGFRNVAVVLAVRARYEIAQGKWDEAARTLQTGYAAGRHMGKGPTFIHVIIGGAIARWMDQQVEAWIQQPGAPNLYWALTDLPRPYLNPELAVEQESRMIDRMMPWVKRLDGPPMSAAEVGAVAAEMHKANEAFSKDFGLVQPSELGKISQAFFLVQGYGEAKRGLLARDKFTAEQIEALPEFQVISLYAYLEYRDSLDETLKWLNIPNGVRHPGFKKSAEKYQTALTRLDRMFFGGALAKLLNIGGAIGATYRKIYETVGRTDRRIAALECVEALRLYAAQNGKWPAALADVIDVPVPTDPVTGKPFEYRVQENKAVLAAPSVTPGKSDGPDAVSYEVFLRK
jgi:hypothetical protein